MFTNFFKNSFILFAAFFIFLSSEAAANGDVSFDLISVGDIIEFGNYEQNNNFDDKQERIEWIVLEVEEDKALIISKYGLDAVQFHNKITSPDNPLSWKMSSIRAWLNQDFYENAFSEDEKNRIISLCLDESSDISDNLLLDGMEDRVFILSVDEVIKYMKKENRMCRATPYAKSKKIWIGWDGNCWWWLRTPGEEHDYITHVGTEGDLHIYGNRATAKDGTVRPALWLKLND